jgi:hypothetical protein
MNQLHKKQETAALWVQYNDLMAPVFTDGISNWIDNGARAVGVLQPAVRQSMHVNDTRGKES